jgi:hypothetical protein
MGWNHGAWGADDWFAMRFIMLVFWGLLAALVVWLAGPPPQRRRAAGVHRHESQDDGAWSLAIRDSAVMIIFAVSPVRPANQARPSNRGRLLDGHGDSVCAPHPARPTANPSSSAEEVRT